MGQCLESSKFKASNYPLLVDSITFLALMQDTHMENCQPGKLTQAFVSRIITGAQLCKPGCSPTRLTSTPWEVELIPLTESPPPLASHCGCDSKPPG